MSNHMPYGRAVLLATLLVGGAVTGSPARARTALKFPPAVRLCRLVRQLAQAAGEGALLI